MRIHARKIQVRVDQIFYFRFALMVDGRHNARIIGEKAHIFSPLNRSKSLAISIQEHQRRTHAIGILGQSICKALDSTQPLNNQPALL